MTEFVQTIFLSTAEQKARWKAATKGQQETVSSICRKALDNYSTRIEKKAAGGVRPSDNAGRAIK